MTDADHDPGRQTGAATIPAEQTWARTPHLPPPRRRGVTIGGGVLAAFALLVAAAGAAGVAAGWTAHERLPLGGFRPLAALAAGGVGFLIACVALYRAAMLLDPHLPGPFAPDGRRTFARHLSLLFHLMLFNSLTRTLILPVPLVTLLYRALGARIGRDSYVAGMLFDPEWVAIGERVMVGHQATLIPHVIENGLVSIKPIEIGSDCTIGAGAIVLSGTVIADGAMVAAGAVVAKNTRIPAGETWGGIPARRLGAPAPGRAGAA